jgi:hypothetical protein
LARHGGEDAAAVLRVDQEPGPPCLAELAALPEVHEVKLVDLSRVG